MKNWKYSELFKGRRCPSMETNNANRRRIQNDNLRRRRIERRDVRKQLEAIQ